MDTKIELLESEYYNKLKDAYDEGFRKGGIIFFLIGACLMYIIIKYVLK